MRFLHFSLSVTIIIDAVVNGQITRQECINQGGQVVGDIGNGAMFSPTYVCDSNNLPPINVVIASPGEPIATDGEVCCGGGANDLFLTTSNVTLTQDACFALGGIVVEELSPMMQQCPNQQEPLGIIDDESTSSNPQRQPSSLWCCPNGLLPTSPPSRQELTRQECIEENNGMIVGDIGNGAIFQPNYTCQSNGQPPVGNIVQDTPPFAIEGEVCCSLENSLGGEDLADRDEVSRQECVDELQGEIIGDIGNGATRRDDYVCDSTGEPPLANIVPADGEPIAIEGEVCCGREDGTMSNSATFVTTSTESPTDNVTFFTTSTESPTDNVTFFITSTEMPTGNETATVVPTSTPSSSSTPEVDSNAILENDGGIRCTFGFAFTAAFVIMALLAV